MRDRKRKKQEAKQEAISETLDLIKRLLGIAETAKTEETAEVTEIIVVKVSTEFHICIILFY